VVSAITGIAPARVDGRCSRCGGRFPASRGRTARTAGGLAQAEGRLAAGRRWTAALASLIPVAACASATDRPSALSLSGDTICAVAKGGGSLAGGGILCWGADDSGRLGNGNIAQALSPGAVPNDL
jgi:hypothetical protein